jgi:hypothetical protein
VKEGLGMFAYRRLFSFLKFPIISQISHNTTIVWRINREPQPAA